MQCAAIDDENLIDRNQCGTARQEAIENHCGLPVTRRPDRAWESAVWQVLPIWVMNKCPQILPS